MARTKNFNKEEVVEKAILLFWEKGFHATSMEDLVSTLGINRASMYNTFGSKQQLFEQALEVYKNKELNRIADFLYYQLNVRQGLFLLFQNQVEQSIQNNTPTGCLVVNTITELANGDSALASVLQVYKTEYETVFYNYLKYGVDQGQISPYKDIKAIAASLFTLQVGLDVTVKIYSEKEELFKLIETTMKVLD